MVIEFDGHSGRVTADGRRVTQIPREACNVWGAEDCSDSTGDSEFGFTNPSHSPFLSPPTVSPPFSLTFPDLSFQSHGAILHSLSYAGENSFIVFPLTGTFPQSPGLLSASFKTERSRFPPL